MANGTLADILLFGCFLVWAVADKDSMHRRPDLSLPKAPESPVNDVIVVVGGMAIYVAIVFWLHRLVIGVTPF